MIYLNNQFLDLDDDAYYYLQVNMKGIMVKGLDTNREIRRLSNELAMIIPASFKLYVQLGHLPEELTENIQPLINFNLN